MDEQTFKKLQRIYDQADSFGKELKEKEFPELKESEDERIKRCIGMCLTDATEQRFEDFNTTLKDCLSWLEKQGEEKHVNYDQAEKEKDKFVSGHFIECRKSFNEFKENNSYWLEYIGDDTYIGRSDNILNQKFHITPRQLFTLFTQQHCPKGDRAEIKEETNIPTGYGKYVDDCLYKAAKRFFSNLFKR